MFATHCTQKIMEATWKMSLYRTSCHCYCAREEIASLLFDHKKIHTKAFYIHWSQAWISADMTNSEKRINQVTFDDQYITKFKYGYDKYPRLWWQASCMADTDQHCRQGSWEGEGWVNYNVPLNIFPFITSCPANMKLNNVCFRRFSESPTFSHERQLCYLIQTTAVQFSDRPRLLAEG
jgi:hypothetical protein